MTRENGLPEQYELRYNKILGFWDDGMYDVHVSGNLTLRRVGYMPAYDFCVNQISGQDTYKEPHMKKPQTGESLLVGEERMKKRFLE